MGDFGSPPKLFLPIPYSNSHITNNFRIANNNNAPTDSISDPNNDEVSNDEKFNTDSVIVENPLLDADTRINNIAQNRFSIGGIIMAIPWLPIEVNVPDTIAWAYNGISSIIAGIGQNLPFRPFNHGPQAVGQQDITPQVQMKLAQFNRNELRPQITSMPVIFVPLNLPTFPNR